MTPAATVSIRAVLRSIAPFAELAPDELDIIAQHGKARTYKAGTIILPQAATADMLVVQTGGSVIMEEGGIQRPAPPVFDAAGLLFGLASVGDYIAGPDGLEALLFAKPHVYTMARECPAFIVGLLHMQESHTQ